MEKHCFNCKLQDMCVILNNVKFIAPQLETMKIGSNNLNFFFASRCSYFELIPDDSNVKKPLKCPKCGEMDRLKKEDFNTVLCLNCFFNYLIEYGCPECGEVEVSKIVGGEFDTFNCLTCGSKYDPSSKYCRKFSEKELYDSLNTKVVNHSFKKDITDKIQSKIEERLSELKSRIKEISEKKNDFKIQEFFDLLNQQLTEELEILEHLVYILNGL